MKRLSKEVLAELKEAGFVHVTGLPFAPNDGKTIVVTADPKDLGMHNHSQGRLTIITEDGQVWIGTYTPDKKLLETLCPRGNSNGDWLPVCFSTTYLLERFANPYSGIKAEPAEGEKKILPPVISA